MRLTPDQTTEALEMARAHGTTVAAEWFGVTTSTMVKLRRRADGYTRGRGHPTAAEKAAAQIRDDCRCARCRHARGVTVPILTPEQQAMVVANTGLVGFVLGRRATRTEHWDDRFQDGLIGLMRAAQLFDPDKGFRFSTYALHWIRQGVDRGEAEALGKNYRAVWRNGRRGDYVEPTSLDADVPRGEDLTIADVLPAFDDTAAAGADRVHRAQVRDTLAQVCRDDVDRRIMEGYALGQTVLEIALDVGIAQTNVRARWDRMRTRLRHPTARRAYGVEALDLEDVS